MPDDLEQQIRDAAARPAEARTEEIAIKSHSLSDLIAADRYLAAKKAAKSSRLPIRITYIQPPGAS